MERAWSCYRGGNFNCGIMVMLQKRSLYCNGNGHREFVLWRGVWSCYRGGQFNGERMVLLRRWPV